MNQLETHAKEVTKMSAKTITKIKKLVLSAALALTLFGAIGTTVPLPIKPLPGEVDPQVNWNS